MPVLSVVVPTYNMEQWLPVALESCLEQSHRELDIIVLNDGSSDRSGDIAERYAALDSRVRHVAQANAGLGAARQAGQDAARGDYITWLDADDALLPDSAAVMLAVAKRDAVPMVCGNAIVFSDKTFNTRRYFPHPPASRLTFAESPAYWKSKVVWRWIFSLPFLRTGKDGSGFTHPHFKFGQDVCFMFDLFTRVDAFSQCEDDMYLFRQEHKSAVRSAETLVEHEIAQYVRAREILLAPANGERFVKPLVKYLNENYWRDVREAAPRLLLPDGSPRTPEDGRLAERVLELGLDLFTGVRPEWLSQSWLAPELKEEAGLRPLAEAFIATDKAAARRLFAGLAANQPKDVDKQSAFHTLRRRVKAFFNPRSRLAARTIRRLEAKARQRLGSS